MWLMDAENLRLDVLPERSILRRFWNDASSPNHPCTAPVQSRKRQTLYQAIEVNRSRRRQTVASPTTLISALRADASAVDVTSWKSKYPMLKHHMNGLQRPNCLQSIHVKSQRRCVLAQSARSFDSWYGTDCIKLSREVGSIQVVAIEGKGRGLVATQNISQGDLIMATPALSIVRGPSGERHHPDALIDDVFDSGAYRSAWFHVLYDGSDTSTLMLPNLSHHSLTPPGCGADERSGSSSRGSSSSGSGSSDKTDRSSAHSGSSGSIGQGPSSSDTMSTKNRLTASSLKAKSKQYVGKDRIRPPEPFLTTADGTPMTFTTGDEPPSSASEASREDPTLKQSEGSSTAGSSTSTASGGVSTVVKRGAVGVKRSKGVLKGKKVATAAAMPPGLDKAGVRRIAQAVQLNCYGDGAEDLAAMACRGEEPSSHLGLFPEFSLFNHSCAPNAINYVLNGDTMIVRAASDVKAGEEVTISYMGRPQLTPVGERLEHLQRDYGFICDCKRCTKESALAERLDECYDLLYEETEETLGPEFLLARTANNLEKVADIRDSLRASLMRLETLFRKERVVPTVRLYVNASLYECYELLLQCEQTLLAGAGACTEPGLAGEGVVVHVAKESGVADIAGAVLEREGDEGEDEAEDSEGDDIVDLAHDADTYVRSLHTCVKALEAVTCGSDLHAIVSSRYAAHLRSSERVGAESGSAHVLVEADRLAVIAHVARYGRVEVPLMRALMEHNMEMYE